MNKPDRPPPRRPAALDAPRPRYLQIADILKAGILDGTTPVGARLPTEAELCERHEISRFTAREAVRVLSSAGLVTRRQRAGTVVIALPGEARYTLAVAALDDLQQYARDTEMHFTSIGHRTLDATHARSFGDEPGARWTYAEGIRRESASERPLCITRLYFSPRLPDIDRLLVDTRGAIYAQVEREYGLSIERVEQELCGALLDAEDAAQLQAAAGAPALQILRRYYDADGRLLEASESLHPADRFAYRMEVRK